MRRFGWLFAWAAAFAPSTGLADRQNDGPWSYDQMMWGGGYGMGGGLMMLVFWGLIIVLIVFAVRWFTDGQTTAKKSDPMDILKERFAKGEIDEDEFQRRKRTLES